MGTRDLLLLIGFLRSGKMYPVALPLKALPIQRSLKIVEEALAEQERALFRVAPSAEEDDIRRRHLAWCFSLASHVEEMVSTPRFPELLDQLDRERFNLREALGWSLRTGQGLEQALLICGYLPLYWDTRGYVPEGLRWSSDILAAGESTVTPGRAMAMATVGWLAMLAGEPGLSEESLSGSDEMWRELDDIGQLSRSLSMHGMTTYNLSDLDRAEAMFDESAQLARQAGVEWVSDAWCVYGLAHIALARGDMMTADQLLRSTLEYSRSRGLTWGVGSPASRPTRRTRPVQARLKAKARP